MDLTPYMAVVNRTKREHEIFNVEAFNLMVSGERSPVLILKKSWGNERALIIINKDLHAYQHLFFPDWDKWLDWPLPGAVKDLSPEYAMDYVPLPLDYHLRPAQVMVLHSTKG
jgi:starch synthase (maltosyl-transferring)